MFKNIYIYSKFFMLLNLHPKKNQKYIKINHGKKTVGNGYRSLINM